MIKYPFWLSIPDQRANVRTILVSNAHSIRSIKKTEYQSKFNVSPKESPSEIRDNIIEPVEPTFTTIYQDSYVNHNDGVAYDHDEIDYIEPVLPFYLSEYQAAYEMRMLSAVLQPGTYDIDFLVDGNGDRWDLGYQLATEVPLPAGVWLLGSALLGVAGVARKRKHAA